MNSNIKDTALLVFAQSAKAECKSKTLVTPVKDVAAFRLFNQYVQSIADQSGLQYYIIDERAQHGSTFGQRLANAFQDVFSRGHENIIAIGNDCLSLCPEDIDAAKQSLNEHSAVLGPDLNGGAYLIGINKAQFDLERFSNLTWQSSNTLDSLKASLGTVIILDQKTGINTIEQLLATDDQLVIKSWVLKVLGFWNEFLFSFIKTSQTIIAICFQGLRAPPV